MATKAHSHLLPVPLFLTCCLSGGFPWSRLVSILEQKSGADIELQVFAMTLINKVRAGRAGR